MVQTILKYSSDLEKRLQFYRSFYIPFFEKFSGKFVSGNKTAKWSKISEDLCNIHIPLATTIL